MVQDQKLEPKTKKKLNISRGIDTFLWFVLLILVIFAYVDGQFIKKEVVVIDTCSGMFGGGFVEINWSNESLNQNYTKQNEIQNLSKNSLIDSKG